MVGTRERVLEQLLEATAAPYLLLDADLRIEDAHPTVASRLGRDREELRGTALAALIEDPPAETIGRWVGEAAAGDVDPDTRTVVLRDARGAPVEMGLRRQPIPGWGTERICLVVSAAAPAGAANGEAEADRLIHDLSNELSVLVHYGGFVADGLEALPIGTPLARTDVEALRTQLDVLRGAIERTAALTHGLRAAVRGSGEPSRLGGSAPAPNVTPAEPLPGPDRPAHLLVAEDDDAVRALTVRILDRAGYRVTTASSGREAFELLAGLDGQVDLVLSDLRMADVSGLELDERIRGVWPTMRTLFMSGDPTEQAAAGARVITKPFTVDDLLHRVEEALRGAG